MDRDRNRDLAIVALFVGSGCAALIYEVVWFQLLTLVIGASAISLALLLASFMGGMCLGSITYPKVISSVRHPLRMYAALELLIAAFGLIILWLLPNVGKLYWSFAGSGYAGMTVRGFVAVLILLPPTVLMGATLPAVARWVKTNREGISRLGFFYGANTAGAVIGSLLAGFYLLRAYDVVVATYVAVAVNVVVALVALALARRTPYQSQQRLPSNHMATSSSKGVYIVVGLSGLTALGAEVIWTRQLSLLFGPTVYTFSIILAVFLTGIGIGSAYGALLAKTIRRPAIALAICQLLLVLAIPFAAAMIIDVIPYWFSQRHAGQSIWERMILDLVRAAAALLPATCLWGASFPLAVCAAGTRDEDPGGLVGRVYASNTVGAILGSLFFSLLALPLLGSQGSQQALTFLAALGGIFLLCSTMVTSRHETEPQQTGNGNQQIDWIPTALVVLIITAAVPFAVRWIPGVPKGLLAYGRNIERWDASLEYHYVGEGIDAAVVVTTSKEHNRCFHVSGKVVASNSPSDMRIERMLGHLPAMVHPRPRTALVVGCGAGVTAGSLLKHTTIERIVICEIEPHVPKAAQQYFSKENYGVIDNPRVEVILDDARHFLSSTNEKFDIITTDPIHPWVRGAAALYTTEFFDICKAHLNPGGVVAQWVPLYESSEAAVKCELATFLQSFPNATVWNSGLQGSGYDVVVIGNADGQPVNISRVVHSPFFNQALGQSLTAVGLGTSEQLLHTYSGSGSDLADWLKDAPINRDHNLRLQYLAGLALDSYTQGEIYEAMTSYRNKRNSAAAPPRYPLAQ